MLGIYGQTCAGKTTELCNIAKAHINMGDRVLLITLETLSKYIKERINEASTRLTVKEFKTIISSNLLTSYLYAEADNFDYILIDNIRLIKLTLESKYDIIEILKSIEENTNTKIIYTDQLARKCHERNSF